MKKQAISEEQGVHKQWYEEAKTQTLETLPAFLTHLTNDYHHDYGTYVHQVAAAAIAAAWACGDGLSGYQAGAVMWQFVQQWQYSGNKCGLRILDYDNVLYPQYEDKFAGQTLSAGTWKAIQQEAQTRLDADVLTAQRHVTELAEYHEKLAAFKLEYPDYDERPDYYLPLSSGTGVQWEAERLKQESGFRFAPVEPYKAVAHPNVTRHWANIVRGRLPFQMRLSND